MCICGCLRPRLQRPCTSPLRPFSKKSRHLRENSIVCGIAGIVRFDGEPVFEQEIRAMCEMLVHRGPDEEGVYLAAGIGLGMRRLSIIDLDSSQQPICNEDRSIWVVFNGEIYNYPELRQTLIQRGH